MQNNENRFYNIGGLSICYKGPSFFEKEYLSIFRTEEKAIDICYQMIQKEAIAIPEIPCIYNGRYIEIYEAGEQRVRIIYDEAKAHILVKDSCCDGKIHLVDYQEKWIRNWSSNLIMKLFDLPYQMLLYNGIFLHASYIIWNGKAILFTAPKQTGKSTQARLWEKFRNAQIVNGDRALIRKQGNQWMVFGSPYSGTSRICQNISSPLGAIILLSQSEKNYVRRAKPLEACIALMDGCTYQSWNREEIYKVTEIANDLILNIPFYKLECLPNESAVRILEEALWQ